MNEVAVLPVMYSMRFWAKITSEVEAAVNSPVIGSPKAISPAPVMVWYSSGSPSEELSTVPEKSPGTDDS